MNKIILIVLILLCIFLSFSFGKYIGQRNGSLALKYSQATISFHHLQEYTKISSDIKVGCMSLVKARLKHRIDTEKMLLAKNLSESSNESIKDYINLRDNLLLQELESYKVDWNKVKDFPGCDKSESLGVSFQED